MPLRFRAQVGQLGLECGHASQEVIAGALVIDIRHDGMLAELFLLDQLATSRG